MSVGQTLSIESQDYVITSIVSDSQISVSPIPIINATTTENAYYYDYISYSELRSVPDAVSERIKIYFEDEGVEEFFFYSIDYNDVVPLIVKSETLEFNLVSGVSDSIDQITGRVQISNVQPVPLQINIGMSSSDEDIHERTMLIDIEKEFASIMIVPPTFSSGRVMFTIGGTSCQLSIFNSSTFFLQGIVPAGTTSFFDQALENVSVSTSGSNTILEFDAGDPCIRHWIK